MGAQCPGKRVDGSACRARPTKSGFCFFHDPSVGDDARRELRRKGGRRSSATARLRRLLEPARLVPVYDALEGAFRRLDAGEIEPEEAQAMAAVASAMVKVVTAGEIEVRLRAIEEALSGEPSG